MVNIKFGEAKSPETFIFGRYHRRRLGTRDDALSEFAENGTDGRR